jgi:peptidoglycan/LPS O-acetylase OafA/YrhL
MGLRAVFYHGPVVSLGPDFLTTWSLPPTGRSILDHVLLISNARDERFDPVSWTLTHEMRMSIIFPFIMLAVTRWNGWVALAVAMFLSRVGVLIAKLTYHDVPFGDTLFTSYALFMFVTGAVLAKYSHPICTRFAGLRPLYRVVIGVLGVTAYAVASAFPEKVFQIHVSSYLATFGSAIMIIVSLASPAVARVLSSRPLVFLGRISYSLYLYHMIVFYTLIHTVGRAWPPNVILAASAVASIAIAEFAYRAVEAPSIKLGRFLTRGSSRTTSVSPG